MPHLADGPRRILVPVDFTPATRKAVQHAIALGRQTHARVFLLHACLTEIETFESERTPFQAESFHLEVEQFLSELVAEISAAGLTTDCHLMHKSPFEAILAAAQQLQADLIVMGTRTSVKGANRQDSVADHVRHNSVCPVVVVKA